MDLAEGGVRAALRSAVWRKSRYSNPSGECVEVAQPCAEWIAVRDSRSPGDGVLLFARAEWERFLTRLRGQAS